MTEKDILDLVKEAMMFAAPELATANPTLDSKLSELGVSSITSLEIIGFLEDKLGIRFPDDELVEISTVRDLEKLIRRHLTATAAE